MAEEKRLEWMTSIASNVNPEDYLLGRKIDKTFELSQKEKAEKVREARIELIAKNKIKHSDDPLLDLERRRRELKMQIIQNPVLLKQFRDRLLKETRLGRKQSSDSGPDTKTGRHEDNPSSASKREVRDGPRDRESNGRRHHRSAEDRPRHQNAKSEDHESRHHKSKHNSSSGWSESNRHGSRHSDERHKHRSSRRSLSRSRSPSSRHKHRHRHHERRDRSRSPSYHRRS